MDDESGESMELIGGNATQSSDDWRGITVNKGEQTWTTVNRDVVGMSVVVRWYYVEISMAAVDQ